MKNFIINALKILIKKQIKIKNTDCNRSIYMAYKKNTYQAPAVRKFIKYINSTSKDIFIYDNNQTFKFSIIRIYIKAMDEVGGDIKFYYTKK